MSFLSNLIKKAAPVVAQIAPGTIYGEGARLVAMGQKQQEYKYQKKLAIDAQATRQREINNMEFRDTDALNRTIYGNSGGNSPIMRQGFGSSFGTFLGDVGQNILSPLSGLFSQVRPFISQQSAGQPALSTRSTIGGQESQQSGVTQGFMGGFGNLAGQASRFLRTPGGQIGTGLLTGIGASMLSDGSIKPRITRKMKSQYRAVLNLAQGDYDQAASMIGVSTDQFIAVLLKRFRNDGAVVTKAALRKTKTTVRRLKSMCDMYDSLRPTATRRKTPMRRASTTLISNK